MAAGRVLLLDSWSDVAWVRAQLEGLGVVVEAGTEPQGDDVVAILLSIDTPLGRDELARLPAVRVVATASTGYDHLDVEALAAAGVWVTHSGNYCSAEVAEHAIALIAGLLRQTHSLDTQVRSGGWDVFAHPPRRIAGSTLAVVGCGRIGSIVTRLAAALGMRVVVYDPYVDAAHIRGLGGEPFASLEEVLRQADVVTIHCWLDETTQGLIGGRELAAMPAGSFVVNAARAGIVDHDALGAALASGHLAGAGVDVLPVEPPPAGAAELGWRDAVLQPHAAWHSDTARLELYRRPTEDIRRVLAGEEPLYPVTRPRG
jgi:D-3-phosphoglycerate dehydrogenase